MFLGLVISVIPRKSVIFGGKIVGVARLKPTRYDNSKGTRIGPSYFYASKLYNKYIKLIEVSTSC
jgi:hypothetical protein